MYVCPMVALLDLSRIAARRILAVGCLLLGNVDPELVHDRPKPT
jgi:hypothetical protein